MSALSALLRDVRACTLCAEHLPRGPRPVLQAHGRSRILIAGQAPGRAVHESGVPFDDASGDRLRSWLGVSRDVFYTDTAIAILPMGFCYPGTGQSGDLPPRAECAPAWRHALIAQLTALQLTIVVGQYAQAFHLRGHVTTSLTETVRAWRTFWPHIVPIPHPSPRNNIWLAKNPWFERELVPVLRLRVAEVLTG